MVELILSGNSANKDVRKKYSESATLDRIGANLAEVLRHADALSAAALVAPLAAVARAGGADNAARLSKKMLGVFFEEKRTDSKVGGGVAGIQAEMQVQEQNSQNLVTAIWPTPVHKATNTCQISQT